MSLWTKFASVFVCAAVCALSLTLLPHREAARKFRQRATPVHLQEEQDAAWLLV